MRLSLIAVAKPTVPRLARSKPRRPARTMSETERPREQQQAGGDQNDSHDVRADAIEKRARRPVEDLAQAPAVIWEEGRIEEALSHSLGSEAGGLRSQREQQSAGNRRDAQRHRLRRGQERTQDQSDAGEPEGDRHHDRAGADGIGESRVRAVPDGAPVPAQIDDVPEVDRQADAGEAGEVEAPLHDLRRGPAPPAGTAARRGLRIPPARRLLATPGRITPRRSAKNAVCKHPPTHSTP